MFRRLRDSNEAECEGELWKDSDYNSHLALHHTCQSNIIKRFKWLLNLHIYSLCLSMLIMLYDISCINYLLLNRFQFFPNKFDLMGLLGLTLMRLLNISNNYLLGAQQSCNLSTLSDSINDSLSSIKSTSIRKWSAVSSPKPQDLCHQQFNCFFPNLN